MSKKIKRTPWHTKSAAEVLAILKTSEEGLSDKEAAKRLQEYGRNELAEKPQRTIFRMLWDQLTDPMILILIGAATLSLFLEEWVEASVILAIVVLNALISIVQEKKAAASLAALKQMSAPAARVLREGEESVIPVGDIVPGDIVIIEDGTKIPADIRLLESSNLKIEEASLTGESVPSEKDAEQPLKEGCMLGDRTNMAFASSIVTYGRGTGIVVATGMETEVGNIAELLETESDFDTPIKRKLDKAGKALTVVGIIVCLIVFGVGMLYGRPFIPQLMLAIAIAVSVIPEGLPATATIVMALGVQRMAKKNALIRKLPAVETLGNATVICTDKTGTLTLNKMTVTEMAVLSDFEKGRRAPIKNINTKKLEAYRDLIYACALCNDASLDPDKKGAIIGDPTEGALIYLAQEFGIDHDDLEEKYPRLFDQPFDSHRKRMSTVHEIEGRITAYTKGAVDEMLPLCTHILNGAEERPITEEDKDRIHTLCHKMSEEALRILGFAKKTLKKVPAKESENIEKGLTFIGIVGMIDPPRKEVAEAVRICKGAGIRTIMITGDHKTTAQTIAKELNIWERGDIIISGDELVEMNDAKLDTLVGRTTVFARVSPRDKLRIIKALKRTGEIAAMTGDGVNDSPALKAADIGIAMGITGTDVAKEASDMILLDDSFTTISHAIKEGRRVYRNIQKVIQFLLSGNIAEIITLTTATVLNWNAPLLAVHILWINLATATLPALALGVDSASKDIMTYKPVKSGTLFERDLVSRVIIQGVFVAVMALIAYWLGVSWQGHTLGQTMAFCVLTFSQILRAFNQRSNTDPIWVRSETPNPWILVAGVIAAGMMAAILLVPALRDAFKLTALGTREWATVILFAASSIVQIEIVKAVKRLQQSKGLLKSRKKRL